jgi:hypothetical protein
MHIKLLLNISYFALCCQFLVKCCAAETSSTSVDVGVDGDSIKVDKPVAKEVTKAALILRLTYCFNFKYLILIIYNVIVHNMI